MRFIRQGLLLLLLALGQVQVAIAAGPVWLLTSHAGGDYQIVVDAFMKRIATDNLEKINVQLKDTDNESDILAINNDPHAPSLIVAIGSKAARLALSAPDTVPVLNILIPQLLYERINATSKRQHSALYIDQPFHRQLNLCRLIVADLRHVAVLYGPGSLASRAELEAEAHNFDITLTTSTIPAGANIISQLDSILENNQLLLALPDPDVFNSYTVSGLLLTAYHHNVPVIGFSAGYVKAGALAAVYSTPEQIGREGADAVIKARTDKGWLLAPPRYHNEYSVTLNRQVAHSLNIKSPNEDELLRKLQQLEHKIQ